MLFGKNFMPDRRESSYYLFSEFPIKMRPTRGQSMLAITGTSNKLSTMER